MFVGSSGEYVENRLRSWGEEVNGWGGFLFFWLYVEAAAAYEFSEDGVFWDFFAADSYEIVEKF